MISSMSNQKIVLATGNPGKINELTSLCSEWPIEVSALEYPVEVDECGLSFLENALLKARAYAREADTMALADDSGLVIDALSGAPGIHSARYAGPACSSKDNIAHVLKQLRDLPKPWTARFVCVLVLCEHANDPDPWIARASWEGEITDQPKGLLNFGYDPIFVPAHHNLTAAELMPEVKNRYSHRFQATRKLTQILLKNDFFIRHMTKELKGK